jgi:hypothetical protein
LLWGLFGGRYRIREREIFVGSPVYARGDFRSIGVPPPRKRMLGLTAFTAKVFDFENRRVRNVDRLLDRNRDGKVSAEERRRGYAMAARLARGKSSVLESEQEFEIYGRLGSSSDHRLLVADCLESELVERLGRWTWIQLAAGAELIALGAGLVAPKFIHSQASVRSPANVPATSR